MEKQTNNFYDKLEILFEKIAFLNLPDEEKGKIAKKVIRDTFPDRIYWTMTILSSLIATFGLLQNSVAVIIGAMLIAPLLRPILGMGLAMARGTVFPFFRAFKVLILSVILSISMGMLFSFLIPIKYETSEILSRTAPNILDLFIAIFSAIVAVLSLRFTRLSESVAGVAMAASLMPPLAVVGIEIAFGHFSLAWSSFLLFLVNLLAILLVASVTFVIYGYVPHQQERTKSMVRRSTILFLLIFVISVPLSGSLIKISERVQIKKESEKILNNFLTQVSPFAKLSNLTIKEDSQDVLQLHAVVKLPENEQFFTEFLQEIQDDLSQNLGQNISLDIEMIRTANIVSQKEIKDINTIIRRSIRKQFQVNFLDTSLLNVEVVERADDNFLVTLVPAIQAGDFLEKTDQQKFEKDITKIFAEKTFSFSFVWIPVSQRSLTQEKVIQTPEEIFDEKIYKEWRAFFQQNIEKDWKLSSLEIFWEKKKQLGPLDKKNISLFLAEKFPEKLDDFNKIEKNDIEKIQIDFSLEVAEMDRKKILKNFRKKLGEFPLNYPVVITFNGKYFFFETLPLIEKKNIIVEKALDDMRKKEKELHKLATTTTALINTVSEQK